MHLAHNYASGTLTHPASHKYGCNLYLISFTGYLYRHQLVVPRQGGGDSSAFCCQCGAPQDPGAAAAHGGPGAPGLLGRDAPARRRRERGDGGRQHVLLQGLLSCSLLLNHLSPSLPLFSSLFYFSCTSFAIFIHLLEMFHILVQKTSVIPQKSL